MPISCSALDISLLQARTASVSSFQHQPELALSVTDLCIQPCGYFALSASPIQPFHCPHRFRMPSFSAVFLWHAFFSVISSLSSCFQKLSESILGNNGFCQLSLNLSTCLSPASCSVHSFFCSSNVMTFFTCNSTPKIPNVKAKMLANRYSCIEHDSSVLTKHPDIQSLLIRRLIRYATAPLCKKNTKHIKIFTS